MSGSTRPILAAPPSVDGSPGINNATHNPQQPPNVGPKPKRILIESACAACRKRKSKCDGSRPMCSRCQTLRTECIYEAQQGESRWSALRRRKKDVESDREDMRELLTFLQQQPESEALDIFHRIRSNGFEDLLRLIRHARDNGQSVSSSKQLISPPNHANDQPRLPSIRAMLEDSAPLPIPAQAQAGPALSRSSRLPSLSSDGSGDSYSSTYSAHSTRSAHSSRHNRDQHMDGT